VKSTTMEATPVKSATMEATTAMMLRMSSEWNGDCSQDTSARNNFR
jgi:hypothetical protein